MQKTSKRAELSIIFYIYWSDRNIWWIWMRLTAWYTVTVLSTDLWEKREWHLKGMSQTSPPWPLCAVKLSLSACWHIEDEKSISSEIISKQTSKPALIYHDVLHIADVCDYTAPSSGKQWNCKAGSICIHIICIYGFSRYIYHQKDLYIYFFLNSCISWESNRWHWSCWCHVLLFEQRKDRICSQFKNI